MKKKTEPKSVGPLKEEEFIPWSGITLNRCLAVAAIAALLSVGFQVLQEAADSDDLAEDENEVWAFPESNDQQSDPWFFEGWFGSSTTDLPDVEEPEAPETVEPDVETEEEVVAETEELEESVVNEQDITNDEQNEEEIEIETEPIEPEKKQVKQEQNKPAEQWGLKSKEKYMESKAIKIRIADKDAPSREAFPFNFAKKPKDSAKPYSPEREKSYKDKKHQLKYEEKKYDHPKKEYEKPFKKEKEDKNKYFKQEKGKKEDKDYKGHKKYNYEKDYKKKYDPRHHG
ncbi:junctional sarcoplasmic reticulum protein 1 [Hyperolius riggenbachi]|uniref:junctional sarcoplasmic reticulum protein 1 n=1 Tax=Hyperolius riggenbachi TaxID=752182 RepID=UPI0035A28854